MFFSNIKDRSLPVLEQACERYSLMIYEVFRIKVAYGFQSIRYSYQDSETPGRGNFTATFSPFFGVATDCKATRVTFVIESKSQRDAHDEDDEWWEFSDFKIEDLEPFSKNPVSVRFTEGGYFVVIETTNEWEGGSWYTVGNGPIPHAGCGQEELESKYKLSDILIVS